VQPNGVQKYRLKKKKIRAIQSKSRTSQLCFLCATNHCAFLHLVCMCVRVRREISVISISSECTQTNYNFWFWRSHYVTKLVNWPETRHSKIYQLCLFKHASKVGFRNRKSGSARIWIQTFWTLTMLSCVCRSITQCRKEVMQWFIKRIHP